MIQGFLAGGGLLKTSSQPGHSLSVSQLHAGFKNFSAGGGLLKTSTHTGHSTDVSQSQEGNFNENTVAGATYMDPSAGGGLLRPQINPGHLSPALNKAGECSVGVLFVHRDQVDYSSPQVAMTDPLETLSLTPEILPDMQINDDYSPIEDWTTNLSRNTPVQFEESVLSDIKTPTPTNSPFWTEPTPSPTNPLTIVEATYSRTTTPDFQHGPTTYFSKKLRQQIILSRQRRKSRASSQTPQNVVISLKKQRLIATSIQGIAKLDDSNKGRTNF